MQAEYFETLVNTNKGVNKSMDIFKDKLLNIQQEI